MIHVNYHKRKNLELFKSLEDPSSLFLSNTQNYIPIYNKFFSLNDTNFNSINLNHKWYISSVNEYSKENENENVYNCRIKNVNTNKTKEKKIFFKMAPLLDPYKYLIGKYNINDKNLFNLPSIHSTESDTNAKLIDVNNSAYVDGLFLFLTSNLIYDHNFCHGVDYYGSFLTIKNDFKLNIFDDIDYLNNSDFFKKNKNTLFTIDDYEHLFNSESEQKKPIKIEYNSTLKSNTSIKSFNDDLFENIFEDTNRDVKISQIEETSVELIDITNGNLENMFTGNNVTLKSNSTCSSRSSHTSEGDNKNCENCENIEEINDEDTEWEDEDSNTNTLSNDEDQESNDQDEDEKIIATIPKFPVQIICMENCENTFDNLILKNDLTNEEWFSAFMQIIMILITYQKSFAFTHNDLHTNNVMYNHTDKKYIFYCYNKKYYKVPTFGRIFKIIDFGRSIYKFDGKLFCSDSFQTGGDAATQYNIEPFFNKNKPRLEPNYSFDLCRLACSIFDYVIDDFEEIKDLDKCMDPVKKLIVSWCLDDKGINMLYKNNGVDRYPDFKLYKMIARCVHNHTPQAQLERPEFKAFSNFKGDIPNDVINIDNIPSYV